MGLPPSLRLSVFFTGVGLVLFAAAREIRVSSPLNQCAGTPTLSLILPAFLGLQSATNKNKGKPDGGHRRGDNTRRGPSVGFPKTGPPPASSTGARTPRHWKAYRGPHNKRRAGREARERKRTQPWDRQKPRDQRTNTTATQPEHLYSPAYS